jgi:DNA mismatch repair protein MutS2
MIVYPESAFDKTGFTALLKQCSSLANTETGAEAILLIEPSRQGHRIERLLAETREMTSWITVEGALSLSCTLEIPAIIRQLRIEGNLVPPHQLLQLLRTLSSARIARAQLIKKDTEFPLLAAISTEMPVFKDVETRIADTVDDFGEVKDSASPELRAIRRRMASKKAELRQRMQQILRQARQDGMVSDEEATIRNGRAVLPLKAEFKRQFAGFIHDVSGSGQTVYIEPADVLHMNNEVRELEAAELAEIDRILRALAAFIRPFSDALDLLVDVVTRLDVIHARARLGLKWHGITPELAVDAHLECWHGRNPNLMLRELGHQRAHSIIPLDLRLEADERALIITGPNAGGKSVALKTLGVFQLLVQCGFALPLAEGSKLPVISGLFVDLGDDQSIENDLSTFSSRLLWMKNVLEQLEKDALVLVDEAGAGTDPDEGSALYQAFISECIDRGARVVATTHYGQLKVFAHNTPGCVNASMEFDLKTLAPNYVLKKGIPGSSYAFEIGRRLGLPDAFLKKARSLVGRSKAQLEKLILEMERQTQLAAESRQQSDALAKETQRIKTDFEQRSKNLNREKQKIRDKALREARQLLMETNKTVEKLVRDIQETKADKKTVTAARKDLENARKTIEVELVNQSDGESDAESLPIDLPEAPKPGDSIRLKTGTNTGELLEVDGKHASILVNGLKVRTSYKNLVKVQPPQAKKPRITFVTTPEIVVRTVAPSLDIRGFRGEAALSEVTHYLDEARRAGLNQVDIIHGKGNGILSKLIHEQLRGRSDVGAFDFAPWDQGGPGCTVVKFR